MNPTTNPDSADRTMREATQALLQWQLAHAGAGRTALPVFDEAALREELQGFVDWCVNREFAKPFNEIQQTWWEHSCKVLAKNFAEQPQFAMRRLDGSTALGPISYDLAALLRAADLAFDEPEELDWAIRYWEQARKPAPLGLALDDDFGSFWQQLEWTGLQRHLAQLGLICRAKHRDSDDAGMEALPRLFAFAIKVTTRYVQLSPLTHLLQDLQGSMVQTGFTLR